MKDNYGDKITVAGNSANNVYIDFARVDEEGNRLMRVDMALTPKKARKLARKINQAASAIEIRERGMVA